MPLLSVLFDNYRSNTRCLNPVFDLGQSFFGHIHDMSSSQCSIDSLPIEILNEIFINSLQIASYKGQKLLTSVSRKWRNAAQSCPQIWTTISLDVENIRPPIPYLEKYLERSKNLSIDLRIEAGSREADPIPPGILVLYLGSVAAAISQHMGRLRTLHIHTLSLESFIGRFLTALPFAEAKRLESADISCDLTEEGVSTFAKAPALQRLRCRWWGELRPLTLFPLHRLIHLDLRLSLAWEEIAQLLPLCPSLVFLHLNSRFSINPQALPVSIPLPNLKGFTLSGSTHDMYFMLPKIHCPNLRAFCLSCENVSLFEDSSRSYDPLFQFLASGSHCLQYLRLHDSNFPMALLSRLFAIPSLTTIYFFDFLSEVSSGNMVPERIGDDDLPGVDFVGVERGLKEAIETSNNPNVQGMAWSIQPTDPGYIKMRWANLTKPGSILGDSGVLDNVMHCAELSDHGD